MNYEIAGKVFEINSLHDTVHALCALYKTEKSADFSLKTTENDIFCEREASLRENPDVNYPDAYLETLAVYRKIAEIMLGCDTLLFHGSCIALDGVGYLFTAKSGTGKSTHTRLWREYFGERAVMVNDDKPLFNISGGKVTAYGTPWNGKHHLGENISVPLGAVCILERGKTNEIKEITYSDAFPMLLQQAYRPKSAEGMAKLLSLIDALGKGVRLYRLRCNMETEAAEVAYNGMKADGNI